MQPLPPQVQQQYEAALAEDASVFDYDGVYDSLQQQKVQPRQQEKIERKSRCGRQRWTLFKGHGTGQGFAQELASASTSNRLQSP
jgi:hypothetical protein